MARFIVTVRSSYDTQYLVTTDDIDNVTAENYKNAAGLSGCGQYDHVMWQQVKNSEKHNPAEIVGYAEVSE